MIAPWKDELEFEDEDETDAKRRAELIRRARIEGAEAAYLAALDVCGDKAASGQARAAAESDVASASCALSIGCPSCGRGS